MSKLLSGYLWAWTDVEAGEKAVKLLKKFHPDSDIFINVDYDGDLGGYTKLAKEVGGTISRHDFQVGYCGDFGDRKFGRTHWPRENTIEWIDKLYAACKKATSKYMIILEEDTFLLRPLSVFKQEFSMLVHASMPSAAGRHRPNGVAREFLDYSTNLGGVGSCPGYGAGGGCIFNREQFIASWEKAREHLWNDYHELERVNKIIGWQDFVVQFVMMIGGYPIDQLFICAQEWEHPNWRNEPNYKGEPYEMIGGMKDHKEIVI
jgi:hypothetical protein